MSDPERAVGSIQPLRHFAGGESRARGTSEAEYPGSVRVGSWVQIPTLPFPTRGFPGQALELRLRSERFDSLMEEASTPTPQAIVKGQRGCVVQTAQHEYTSLFLPKGQRGDFGPWPAFLVHEVCFSLPSHTQMLEALCGLGLASMGPQGHGLCLAWGQASEGRWG